MATARRVCKTWQRLLCDNGWWFTYWTQRGIADIRAFKSSSVSWWNIAEKFHTQRMEEVDLLQKKFPLERKSYVACNNRGLVWSLLREFRCAIVDYKCSLINCIEDEDTDSEDVERHGARLHSNISVVYIKVADFPRALEYVNRSLENPDPLVLNLASALNNRGVALIHLGKLKEAKADLEKSMREDPKLANSRLHMAYCYFVEQEYALCLEYCEKALAIQALNAQSDYPAVNYLRSHALEALGRTEEAQHEMEVTVRSAYKTGPYKAIFVHLLPAKYPNYDW